MRGIWLSLWYKELHEQKWRSLALTCILLAILLMNVWVVLSGKYWTQEAEVFLIAVALAGLPGALFVGMGVAAGERSSRTLAFSQALPVPRWRLAAVRVAAGAFSILLPSIITWLAIASWLLYLGPRLAHLRTIWQVEGRYVSFASHVNELLVYFVAATGAMLSVYLWTVAAGAKQRTEVRAGVAAVVVFVGLAMLCSVVHVTTGKSHQAPTLLVAALSPMGPLIVGLESLSESDFWLAFCSHCVAFATLAGLAIARWGGESAEPRSDLVDTARRAEVSSSSIMPPRRSEFSALAWKQWRDSIPFCAAALGLILGWTALMVLFELSDGGIRVGAARHLYHAFVLLTAYIGVVLALVVGVGTFASEVQPGLMTFWRSRPIRPSQWFWTKYLTGLASVLLFLLLPFLLSFIFEWAFGGVLSLRHGALLGRDLPGVLPMGWAFVSTICLAFSIAVLMTYLVRQPVYAGILSVCFFLGVFASTSYFASDILRGWLTSRYELTCFSICTSVLAGVILVLAWQAVVRDWGQKC